MTIFNITGRGFNRALRKMRRRGRFLPQCSPRLFAGIRFRWCGFESRPRLVKVLCWIGVVILVGFIVLGCVTAELNDRKKINQRDLARVHALYEQVSQENADLKAIVHVAGPPPDSSDEWVLTTIWLRRSEFERRETKKGKKNP